MIELRLFSITLLMTLLTVFLAVPVSAAELPWPTDYGLNGLEMPFRPADKVTVYQNPPDFSWPDITTATRYELKICRNEALTDVAYSNENVLINFYNFPYSFQIGTYYWSVRYVTSTASSAWTTPRRFRIDPDACEFAVPPISQMINNIGTSHPKIWTTQATLAAFRQTVTTGTAKTIYDAMNTKIRTAITQNLQIVEPVYTPPLDPNNLTDADYAALVKLRNDGGLGIEYLYKSALLYLITGDAAVGAFAKATLIKVSDWDVNGSTSYQNQDQLFREIAYKGAMAYDWIYNILTPTERTHILGRIQARAQVLTSDLFGTNAINKRPYYSHGWTAFGYVGIIGVATIDEIPESRDWLTKVIPTYANVLPPWSNEDGGWSQGTDYFQYSSLSNLEFIDVLKMANIIDLYKKAWSKNQAKYPIYMHPSGSIGAFGDDSYVAPTSYSVDLLTRLASVYQNSNYQWAWQQIGANGGTLLNYIYYNDDNLAAKPPTTYQRANYFKDIGQVAMHSDLIAPDRVSMFFKSSQFGSYNHSHPDQNSFIIQAYGEPLAIDSGYYDYYLSPFDKGYTRQTHAHNTITYDNGKGQPYDNFQAKGKITGFVNHSAFDAVTGDATSAYRNDTTVGKAIRHIVYLRPDMFIVIDDLAVSSGTSTKKFEWWLNAQENIEIDADQKGAKIIKGDAVLDAKIQFPDTVTANRSDVFAGADGVAWTPTGKYAFWPVQKRAWFQTSSVFGTMMVTTLDVHRSEQATRSVTKTINGSNNIELTFADGTYAVIKAKYNTSAQIAAGGYAFYGTAAIAKGNATMLLAGTELQKDGQILVKSDYTSTVAVGGGELTISATEDGNIKVKAPNTTVLRDEKARVIPQNGSNYGITWTSDSDYIYLNVKKGEYKLYLNNKLVPGENVATNLGVTINGTLQNTQTVGLVDIDEGISTDDVVNFPAGFYRIDQIADGLSIQNQSKVGAVIYLDGNTKVNYNGASSSISLSTYSVDPTYTEVILDHTALQGAMDYWDEAENYTAFTGATPTKYSTSTFLSGGVGMSNLSEMGQSQTWSLYVPEDGEYDIVYKYVTGWDSFDKTKRIYVLGEQAGMFTPQDTEGDGVSSSDWRAGRISSRVPLIQGETTLTLMNVDAAWKLDWVGIIKSNKTAVARFGDTFDNEYTGNKYSGNGWIISRYGSPYYGNISIVASPSGGTGKCLKLQDTDYVTTSTTTEYRQAIAAIRNFPIQTGRVSFETRFLFQPQNHTNGNVEINIMGDAEGYTGKQSGIRFLVYSTGQLGYADSNVAATGFHYIPNTSPVQTLQANVWYTAKFNIDVEAQTYDLIVTSDAYKTYSGVAGAGSTLDKTSGVWRAFGLPFYSSNGISPNYMKAFTSANFTTSRFTSNYFFDYFKTSEEVVKNSDNTYTAKTYYTNDTGVQKDTICYIAIYDGNMLKSITKQSKVLNPNETFEFNQNINFPNDYLTVKSFFWENTNLLNPIGISKILSK